MDEPVRRALQTDRTIDITTTGRRSGNPHRIEIWFHNLEGEIFLPGRPGARDWYANLLSHPDFTFHLKGSIDADLHARARPITDRDERRQILSRIVGRHHDQEELERWVEASPLVGVTFPDDEGSGG